MPRTATASAAPRNRVQADLVQAAIVALLCERESHGYELLSRLDELGICPGTVALYRTLRSMEGEGTVCSSWECPARALPAAPTRPTDGARCRLAGVLEAAMENAERQRATVTRLLELDVDGSYAGQSLSVNEPVAVAAFPARSVAVTVSSILAEPPRGTVPSGKGPTVTR